MKSAKTETICAVVVTYNRKKLLIECLEALLKQTRPLDGIYIIDNASTDGTPELLKEKGFIQELPPKELNEPWEKEFIFTNHQSPFPNHQLPIYYVRMHENTGGAGGFHEGVKRAYEKGYDWLWLMDDDGIPANECLNVLIDDAKYNNLKAINPLVVNINNRSKLSFGLSKKILTVTEAMKCANNKGIIYNKVNPFNGTLLNKTLIKVCGFIKKEMFIWGDEVEYFIRVKKNKFQYGTTINAIFYHPESKTYTETILFGLLKVPKKPEKLECNFFRNLGYLSNISNEYKGYKIVLKYFLFFLLKGDLHKFIEFIKYFWDGKSNTYKLPNIKNFKNK